MQFEEVYLKFWQELGKSRKMVLSTSLNDSVTSRTMSIIILDRKLYFQTDKTFRKYEQLKGNPNVSLCIDNIQIEGQCREVGVPRDNACFLKAYKEHFASSFNRYSLLENERLFMVEPVFIERWVYIDGVPYMEIFDVLNEKYEFNEVDVMEKITLCGDNCLECPRYLAKTEDELKAVAELWYRVGWRDKIVSNDEIQCFGCSSHKKCTYQLVDCIKEKKIEKCNQCLEFPCVKIEEMLKRTKAYEDRCREICTGEEYQKLKLAFFEKEKNLKM